jgi:hypothetical protein
MDISPRALTLVTLVAGLGLFAHDEKSATACSCVGPHASFLSPARDVAAPLNAHVRLEVPSSSAATPLVLRAHRGAIVATRTTILPGPTLSTVELTPLTPLAADTRYEVGTIDANQHPPTTIIGTFKTGSLSDTVPPRLDTLGQVRNNLQLGHVGGGMCSIRGPWITISGYRAQDPDRADARLALAVWSADASGRIDTKRAPDALTFPYRDGA